MHAELGVQTPSDPFAALEDVSNSVKRGALHEVAPGRRVLHISRLAVVRSRNVAIEPVTLLTSVAFSIHIR